MEQVFPLSCLLEIYSRQVNMRRSYLIFYFSLLTVLMDIIVIETKRAEFPLFFISKTTIILTKQQ